MVTYYYSKWRKHGYVDFLLYDLDDGPMRCSTQTESRIIEQHIELYGSLPRQQSHKAHDIIKLNLVGVVNAINFIVYI